MDKVNDKIHEMNVIIETLRILTSKIRDLYCLQKHLTRISPKWNVLIRFPCAPKFEATRYVYSWKRAFHLRTVIEKRLKPGPEKPRRLTWLGFVGKVSTYWT